MTTYQGPHAGIANGNPFLANQVENSFDRFAESVNAVDDTNFPTDNTLTYRSIHPGALTQAFGESQVVHQEPACWVAIGRGGTTKTTDYSLGSSENLYTVDGCSTRVVVSRDGVIKVNSFIEIESIKVSQEILEGTTTRDILTVDLDIEFKLKFMEAGETHASATTLHTVRRRQKVRVWDGVAATPDAAYEAAKGYRRGLSVSLGDDVIISGADPNGSAYDLFVTIEPTIVAANVKIGTADDQALSHTDYDGMLFLAHLRSRSRYTSARFFLE
jgi:hypothetical protein